MALREALDIAPIIARCSEIFSAAKRGAAAMADQGLFAGTHFLLNIMLARWLTPIEYGAFALGYSIFLFLASFHSAILIEPMMVFGAGKYGDRFGPYLRMVLVGHGILTPGIALSLGVAALLAWQSEMIELSQALAGVAIASPFILLLWLLRRSCFIRSKPEQAAIWGGFYLGLLLLLLFGWHRFAGMSILHAYALMGFGAALAGFGLLWSTHLRTRQEAANLEMRHVVGDHWRYGRWSMLTAGLTWIPGNLPLLVLPAVAGLDAAGTLRAAMNLTMPVVHSLAAIGVLLLPSLARHHAAGNHDRFRRQTTNTMAVFFVGCSVYMMVLLLTGQSIFGWLYGDQYRISLGTLVFAGLLPFAGSVTLIVGAALRAMERPSSVTASYVAGVTTIIVCGLPLIYFWDVTGALAAMVASTATTAAALSVLYRQVRREEEVRYRSAT